MVHIPNAMIVFNDFSIARSSVWVNASAHWSWTVSADGRIRPVMGIQLLCLVYPWTSEHLLSKRGGSEGTSRTRSFKHTQFRLDENNVTRLCHVLLIIDCTTWTVLIPLMKALRVGKIAPRLDAVGSFWNCWIDLNDDSTKALLSVFPLSTQINLKKWLHEWRTQSLSSVSRRCTWQNSKRQIH